MLFHSFSLGPLAKHPCSALTEWFQARRGDFRSLQIASGLHRLVCYPLGDWWLWVLWWGCCQVFFWFVDALLMLPAARQWGWYAIPGLAISVWSCWSRPLPDPFVAWLRSWAGWFAYLVCHKGLGKQGQLRRFTPRSSSFCETISMFISSLAFDWWCSAILLLGCLLLIVAVVVAVAVVVVFFGCCVYSGLACKGSQHRFWSKTTKLYQMTLLGLPLVLKNWASHDSCVQLENLYPSFCPWLPRSGDGRLCCGVPMYPLQFSGGSCPAERPQRASALCLREAGEDLPAQSPSVYAWKTPRWLFVLVYASVF